MDNLEGGAEQQRLAFSIDPQTNPPFAPCVPSNLPHFHVPQEPSCLKGGQIQGRGSWSMSLSFAAGLAKSGQKCLTVLPGCCCHSMESTAELSIQQCQPGEGKNQHLCLVWGCSCRQELSTFAPGTWVQVLLQAQVLGSFALDAALHEGV